MHTYKKLFLLLSLISLPSFAQELTSDITGVVVSTSGNAVSGASVSVTYDPTNSTVNRSTNANGRFNVGGLKPGGPYTVKVSSGSYLSLIHI